MKRLLGKVELSVKKVIIFAVLSAVITALVAMIPGIKDTSFNAISVSFEVWILIGVFIIMNSKSNKDSALKCFIFFLISQPLIYLLQVPFNADGFNIFRYYRPWFIWTLLCIPMGYIGYYIKKDKWWGYLILLPMILLTALSYNTYLSYFIFCYPNYALISLFCIFVMIMYPNVLFSNKLVKVIGTIISILLILIITIIRVLNPHIYSTDILSEIDDTIITNDYEVSLGDDKYGEVYIDSGLVHAEFKKKGKTVLIVKTPEGNTKEYSLIIELNTYKLEEK